MLWPRCFTDVFRIENKHRSAARRGPPGLTNPSNRRYSSWFSDATNIAANIELGIHRPPQQHIAFGEVVTGQAQPRKTRIRGCGRREGAAMGCGGAPTEQSKGLRGQSRG